MQVFIGASSVAIPRWTATTIFSLPLERVNAIATRISGSRDLVLGSYLLWSLTKDRRRIKLLSGIAALVNLIDAGSAIACGLEGSLPPELSRNTTIACGSWAVLALLAWF